MRCLIMIIVNHEDEVTASALCVRSCFYIFFIASVTVVEVVFLLQKPIVIELQRGTMCSAEYGLPWMHLTWSFFQSAPTERTSTHTDTCVCLQNNHWQHTWCFVLQHLQQQISTSYCCLFLHSLHLAKVRTGLWSRFSNEDDSHDSRPETHTVLSSWTFNWNHHPSPNLTKEFLFSKYKHVGPKMQTLRHAVVKSSALYVSCKSIIGKTN